MKRKSFILATFIMIIPTYGCSSESIETIELRDERVINYINARTEEEVCKALLSRSADAGGQFGQITVKDDSRLHYFAQFSLDPDFSSYYTVEEYIGKINLTCAIPNRLYYYRIYDANNLNEPLETGKFRTKDAPGCFYNIAGIPNVRDIGGWKTTNGKKIKYGKIIRGSRTNYYGDTPAYNAMGREMLINSLHINGEIDLRGTNDDYGQTYNFIDEDKPFLKAPMVTCNYILPSFYQSSPIERRYEASTTPSIKSIFTFLADESNYPVFIHCNGGADRTGTICFLLEAALGMEVEDLYKDVELTSFSPCGDRLRSKLDAENLCFDPSGVAQDDEYNYVAFGKLVRDLWGIYGPGETLGQAVINFLREVCGVTMEEIEKIRSIMLE